MRTEESFSEVKAVLERGWFPAWAAVEEGALLVDWCALWRICDGKFFFTQTSEIQSSEIEEFKELALKTWEEEKDSFPRHLLHESPNPSEHEK